MRNEKCTSNSTVMLITKILMVRKKIPIVGIFPAMG